MSGSCSASKFAAMRIDHVAIWTRDLERLRKFYETYFGAQAGSRYHNPETGFQSYFLSFPGGARLELMHRNDIGAGAGGEQFGYAHLAFAIGSITAVDQLTNRLVADNYPLLNGPRWTGDGYYESVILDPDGNRIEITI
jgi:lactoylglutathione lyase